MFDMTGDETGADPGEGWEEHHVWVPKSTYMVRDGRLFMDVDRVVVRPMYILSRGEAAATDLFASTLSAKYITLGERI